MAVPVLLLAASLCLTQASGNVDWTLVNVAQAANGLHKAGGEDGDWDGVAVTQHGVSEITLRPHQENKWIRFGLTPNAADDRLFASGHYVCLKSDAETFTPGGGYFPYSVGDNVTMKLEDNSFQVLINGGLQSTKSVSSTGQMHAKIFFFDMDGSAEVLVRNLVV